MRRITRVLQKIGYGKMLGGAAFMFTIARMGGGNGTCPFCGNGGIHPWEWTNFSI